MRLTKLIIAASILLFCAQSAFAQTGYINSSNGINLREGKGTNFNIILSIPSNGEVEIISKEGDWWKVKYQGNEGYVSAKYVTEKSKGRSSNNKQSNAGSERSSSSSSIDYNWGVGIRLGDPSGITLKKYLSDGVAFEVSIGRTRLIQRKHYYKDNFDDWYDDNDYYYDDFEYQGHKASSPIGVQVHYLIQKPLFENDVEGLYWYFGGGGQLSYRTYTYDYRYKLEGSSNWIYETGYTTRDIDFGVDGVIGAEYFMADIPLSFFADFTLFMELYDSPFLFYPNGGLGGRFNF